MHAQVSDRRRRFALALFAVWIAGTAWEFHATQGEGRRVFDASGRADPAALVRELAARPGYGTGSAGLAVVALWDARCRCATAALRHLRELAAGFGPRGVAVFVAPRLAPGQDPARATADARRAFGPGVRVLDPLPERLAPASSPAALVLGERRNVIYFGPLSADAACGGRPGFLDSALLAALDGVREPYINLLATGCLCGWNERPATG